MHGEHGSDGPAGRQSTELVDRLREGDAEATAAFLRSWIGPVDDYCCTVCQPELVAEAIEVTFADFFEKVRSYPIEDAHLGPALLRSTRLTAGEAALRDESRQASEEVGGGFDCERTPLLLAGSPSVPTGIAVMERMREHLTACPRCRASESRFVLAEENFELSGDLALGDRMLDALLGRSSLTSMHDLGERPPAEALGALEDLSAVEEQLLGHIAALDFPLGELVVGMRNALEASTPVASTSPSHEPGS